MIEILYSASIVDSPPTVYSVRQIFKLRYFTMRKVSTSEQHKYDTKTRNNYLFVFKTP